MFEKEESFKLQAYWRILFIYLCIILTLHSPQVAAFPRNTSLASTAATATANDEAAAGNSEANALLKWKASLDNYSQDLLSSWTGTTSPCKWKGILCDRFNSVSNISLANWGLKELAQTMEMNEKCEVYSFGVVTLEIILGKHPGDLISLLFSSSTASMVNNLLLVEMLDQRPPLPRHSIRGEVILFARLAFACLSENPRSRPTMDQISKELVKGKSHLVDQFPMIRLGQLH